jgi:protein-S-isoprenylcysteine O-methyltransferase Ste14
VYFLMALIATVLVWLLLPQWRVVSGLVRGMGGVLLFAGLAVNVIADRAFTRHGTTVKPFEESAALVTTGIFGLTRNPMYVGIVLMLAGVSLLLGSLVALAPALMLAILLDRRFIRIEEKMLAEKFGEVWQAYRERTRRWV